MTPLERLMDAVDQLTLARTHSEPYTRLIGGTWVHDRHTTHVTSLLDQLQECLEPSGSSSSGHRVPTSTPAARLDAMNVLLIIDQEVSEQTRVFFDEERPTVEGNLRALVGLATELGEVDVRGLAKLATRWRVLAATVTGWEVPPQSPHNTCPLCGVLGSLRIRLDVNASTGTGVCVECHSTWDETTIGLLAEHLRSENGEDGSTSRSPAHRPVVVADTELRHWVVTCLGCRWQSRWHWRAAAISAAQEHRADVLGVSA